MRVLIQQEPEIPVISLRQACLEALIKRRKDDPEMIWSVTKWPIVGKERRVILNTAAVSALAKRLKAVEWARARGRDARRDSRAMRLEQEAILWKQRQTPY